MTSAPTALCWLAALAVATACASARGAETLRCTDANGVVLLTNDRSRCVGPVERRLRASGSRAAPEAPVAPEAPHAPEAPRPYYGDLVRVFVPVSELGSEWEEVPEAVEAVSPELAASGVRATRTTHYTRALGPRSEVCSLEVWAFVDAEAARVAAPDVAQYGWDATPYGNLLVVLHGTTFDRGHGFRPGLPASCHAIKGPVGARANAVLR